MARASRICAQFGCGASASGRYCPAHTRDREQQRGTTSARGYGAPHQRQRARWAPDVSAGRVACARCGELIQPGEAWALDHTADRSGYLGPSHKFCNESAAGRAAHGKFA